MATNNTSKKKYGFIKRLVDKVTHKDSSLNTSFTYYGHFVELLSQTVDYLNVDVYKTEDRYSDLLVSFSFDFWTKELYVTNGVDTEIEQSVIDAFKCFYRGVTVTVESEDDDCECDEEDEDEVDSDDHSD